MSDLFHKFDLRLRFEVLYRFCIHERSDVFVAVAVWGRGRASTPLDSSRTNAMSQVQQRNGTGPSGRRPITARVTMTSSGVDLSLRSCKVMYLRNAYKVKN